MLTTHCVVCNKRVSIADICDRKCPDCILFQEPEKMVVVGYTFEGGLITVTVDGIKMEDITHMDSNTIMQIMLAIFPKAHLAEDDIGEWTIHTGIVSK